jgi:hypothetical protein
MAHWLALKFIPTAIPHARFRPVRFRSLLHIAFTGLSQPFYLSILCRRTRPDLRGLASRLTMLSPGQPHLAGHDGAALSGILLNHRLVYVAVTLSPGAAAARPAVACLAPLAPALPQHGPAGCHSLITLIASSWLIAGAARK